VTFDQIIIGQGLAGTCLAWQLTWAGQSVCLIDRDEPVTSSKVAAGLITPITGRRLVTPPNWLDLWNTACQFYRHVEQITGQTFLHRGSAIRLFRSPSEAQPQNPGAQSSGLMLAPLDNSTPFDRPDGGFVMSPAGRLDVPGFLRVSRQRAVSDERLICADVDPVSDFQVTPTEVSLPRLGLAARQLIFCRGDADRLNPWFPCLPWLSAKGELLTLRMPGYEEPRAVHARVWLAPGPQGLYRLGATYDSRQLDQQTTPAAREFLLTALREFWQSPVEVTDQQAAVRPAFHDQQPRIIQHAEVPSLWMLNGLGSKGSLLAPTWAQHTTQRLLGTSWCLADASP